MSRKIILFFTTMSLIGGLVLSYFAIILPVPQNPPPEFTALAESQMKVQTLSSSLLLANQLGKSADVVTQTAEFMKSLWKNASLYPAVASYYSSPSYNQTPSDLMYSAKYSQDIALSASAYKIAPMAFNSTYQSTYLSGAAEGNPFNHITPQLQAEILKSGKVDVLWKQLYQAYPSSAWIYMGFADGFHRTYSYHYISSRGYDPRARPWYTSALQGAKDVVIVLDKSGSMEGARFNEAKNATLQILKQLGPNDRFNIVTFSDTVKTFIPSLEVLNGASLNASETWLNETRTFGTTDIHAGMMTALQILATYGSVNRQHVVLFLTDGAPTTGETNPKTILTDIGRENGLAKAQVLMFGIGNDINDTLMNQIADVTNGNYIPVNSTLPLTKAMTSYQDFLLAQQNEAVSWSFPYFDSSGLGLLISATYPVYYEGTLLGVAATDVVLSSLISLMKTLTVGKSGYNFIVDVGGTTILHPAFINQNASYWEQNNVQKPITAYETTNSHFLNILEQAKARQVGVDVVQYSDGPRVVSMAPIGNTSMILGNVAPLSDMVDSRVVTSLDTLNIGYYTLIPGVALAFLSVLILTAVPPKSLRDKKEALS